MIRLNIDYVVDVDTAQYILKQDTHKQDKNGNTVYKTIGYYGNLESAIKGCIEDMNRTKLCAGLYTLAEALEIIKESSKQFEQILQEKVRVQ